MENLICAETLDGGKLRKVAEIKTDKSIFLEIQGKDCVALEVKYYRRCYLKYTSIIRSDSKEDQKSSKNYQQSFKVLCEQFLQTKIIDDEKILYVTKVQEKFVKIVAEVEKEDASNYNTSHLKQRMQEHFPQLVFQTTKSRGNRELVYSGEMKPSKVVEDIACDYSSQTSS